MKKEDEQSWLSFVNGDDNSFKNLYDQYFEILCDFGCRLHADKEMVKDFIQDAFINLWRKRGELRHIKSIRSYLFTSLRNAIINFHQSPRSKITTIPENDTFPAFNLGYSPEEILIGQEIDKENLAKITNALNNLTIRQKECIYLKYYAGLDYEEIAAMLNISVKACYKLSARALALLKDFISKN